jgi:hypothetical protein
MRRFSHKEIVVGAIVGSYVALAGSLIVFAIVSLITDPNFRV